jgi:hypothetical protein
VVGGRSHLHLMINGLPPSAIRRVWAHSVLSSLLPSCPRTRPKDAEARPQRPGLEARFLAFQSGEGGIRTPGTACARPVAVEAYM